MSKPLILITTYTTTKSYESKQNPGTTFSVNFANLQRGRSVQLVSDGIVGPADNAVVAFVNRAVGNARLTSIEKAADELTVEMTKKLTEEFGEMYDVQVEVTNHRDLTALASS